MAGAVRSLPGDARLPLAIAALGLALVTAAASVRFGPLALAAPAAAAGALMLLLMPRLGVALVLATLVLGEKSDSGLLPWLAAAYAPLPGTVYPVDVLFALTIASVALRAHRDRRDPRLALGLVAGSVLLVLGVMSGVVVGTANGASFNEALFGARAIPYLIVMPLLVAMVVDTPEQAKIAVGFGVALGALKGLIGVGGVALGRGTSVEGSTISFYGPVGNLVTLLVLLGVLAAVLIRARPPVWVLVGGIVSTASLVLSLRRSFWIGAVLAIAIVLALGLSSTARMALVPAVLILVGAIWAADVTRFQATGPVAERAQSLDPTRVQVNAQDRYRLDERVNVVAELRDAPITGLGLAVPWSASARGLPVEEDGGRLYVHMIALWHWLKFGILGLAGYVVLTVATMRLAWQVWRRQDEPVLRALGLAGLAGTAALVVVETSGSFTGNDLRTSAVFGALAGLLYVARADRA